MIDCILPDETIIELLNEKTGEALPTGLTENGTHALGTAPVKNSLPQAETEVNQNLSTSVLS